MILSSINTISSFSVLNKLFFIIRCLIPPAFIALCFIPLKVFSKISILLCTLKASLSNLYEKLYEDNATGKVSDEWFMQLSHKYEVERLELKAKIKTLRQKLSECGQCERDRETFTSAIRRFMRMDKLTAPLLRELIDRIDVFETEGKGKSRTQRIVIYYRFVGYVEIPEVSQRQHIKADTRKGVAVEYLTEPLPA